MSENGKTTVYLSFEIVEKCTSREVRLKDIGEMYCQDPKAASECGNLILHRFKDGEEKKGISVLQIIRQIEQKHPEVSVSCMGSPQILLEYQGARSSSKVLEHTKTVFVCLTAFCAAAFAIMTFNNDGDVANIFKMLYEQFTGIESNGRTVLEAGYSIGLPVGILVFFNHIGKKKDRLDPTPLEVQMRLYGEDTAGSVIEKEKQERVG